MKKTKFLRISLLLLYFVTISSNNFAETMFKDNFQDPSQWRYIGDNVMGGVSKGNVEFKIIDGEAVLPDAALLAAPLRKLWVVIK